MADSKTIRVRQDRSLIGRNKIQRACIRGLGLRRVGHIVELKRTPEVLGMIKKVEFMVTVLED